MLVYIRGTPKWRPVYTVNIWNILWLLRSKRLIISASTKQTRVYISTFPNALTSKRLKNHKISIYFSTNSILHVGLCHATSILVDMMNLELAAATILNTRNIERRKTRIFIRIFRGL